MLALDWQEPTILLLAHGQNADKTLALWQVIPLVAGLLACTASCAPAKVEDHHVFAFTQGLCL
jgi:hypothetical protein